MLLFIVTSYVVEAQVSYFQQKSRIQNSAIDLNEEE